MLIIPRRRSRSVSPRLLAVLLLVPVAVASASTYALRAYRWRAEAERAIAAAVDATLTGQTPAGLTVLWRRPRAAGASWAPGAECRPPYRVAAATRYAAGARFADRLAPSGGLYVAELRCASALRYRVEALESGGDSWTVRLEPWDE